MKILTVLGLFLDLLGVVILGVGEVTRGAASLRHLRESYKDSFDYDVQHRPWYARPLLVLGAKLGAPRSSTRGGPLREPPPYRAFPVTVCGFCLLIGGLLLQLIAALGGATSTTK
jgi:drug/metabolite transporter (DMT)-like permease